MDLLGFCRAVKSMLEQLILGAVRVSMYEVAKFFHLLFRLQASPTATVLAATEGKEGRGGKHHFAFKLYGNPAN